MLHLELLIGRIWPVGRPIVEESFSDEDQGILQLISLADHKLQLNRQTLHLLLYLLLGEEGWGGWWLLGSPSPSSGPFLS